jgi:hypothetical protein
MIVKLLKIYRPAEIHEQKRNDNPGPGIVIFERTNTIRCNNCKWNEYDLMCSKYQLVFKSAGMIKRILLTQMCMSLTGNSRRKQTYTIKSIKRI